MRNRPQKPGHDDIVPQPILNNTPEESHLFVGILATFVILSM